MTTKKPTATVADRLAAIERELSAIRKLVALPQPVVPWWERVYPKAYPQTKD